MRLTVARKKKSAIQSTARYWHVGQHEALRSAKQPAFAVHEPGKDKLEAWNQLKIYPNPSLKPIGFVRGCRRTILLAKADVGHEYSELMYRVVAHREQATDLIAASDSTGQERVLAWQVGLKLSNSETMMGAKKWELMLQQSCWQH